MSRSTEISEEIERLRREIEQYQRDIEELNEKSRLIKGEYDIVYETKSGEMLYDASHDGAWSGVLNNQIQQTHESMISDVSIQLLEANTLQSDIQIAIQCIRARITELENRIIALSSIL